MELENHIVMQADHACKRTKASTQPIFYTQTARRVMETSFGNILSQVGGPTALGQVSQPKGSATRLWVRSGRSWDGRCVKALLRHTCTSASRTATIAPEKFRPKLWHKAAHLLWDSSVESAASCGNNSGQRSVRNIEGTSSKKCISAIRPTILHGRYQWNATTSIAHTQRTGARTGRESCKQLPSFNDVSGMNFFDRPGVHRLWQICLRTPPRSCKLTPGGNHLGLTALR